MESRTDLHAGTDQISEQEGISAACRTTRKTETEICSKNKLQEGKVKTGPSS
jgi:hypothetical protein